MFLLTGGSGFFGEHLTDFLIAKGEQVRSLDILPPSSPAREGFEHVQGDVRDPARVLEAMAGCDVVIHNAALVPVTRSDRDFWSVNVGGTQTVLQTALSQGVRKVIYLSSSSVYGIPTECPIDEQVPLRPFGAYGRSKAGAETLCEEFRARDLDISIVRPRTILGPGRLGILEIMLDRIFRGKAMFILGPGNNRFQLVSAHDLAKACWLMVTAPCRNEDFNVGAQRFGTLREDLESLAAHAGTGSRIVSLPVRPARLALRVQSVLRLGPFVDYHYHILPEDIWFSTAKLETMMGWSADHANDEALFQTYDWYVEHRDQPELFSGSPHRRGVKGRLLGTLLKFI